MAPLVSVIVPVLDDRELARQLIARIPIDRRVEIVVAEAGREPGLELLTQDRPDVKVTHAERGRGRQMNAGAGLSRGEWLLFLHADTQLPTDWLDSFEKAIRPDADGGWFRFALDDPAWQARMIEQGVALRVRLFRLPYGDQGLFVRRQTFVGMGGFRDMPLMEDVDFVRQLTRSGRVVEIPQAITTSARRWRRDGWFRRSARNLGLLGLYFCGVSPARLAKWY
jgi:rSAM/selenodomain-associated transferase 2